MEVSVQSVVSKWIVKTAPDLVWANADVRFRRTASGQYVQEIRKGTPRYASPDFTVYPDALSVEQVATYASSARIPPALADMASSRGGLPDAAREAAGVIADGRYCLRGNPDLADCLRVVDEAL